MLMRKTAYVLFVGFVAAACSPSPTAPTLDPHRVDGLPPRLSQLSTDLSDLVPTGVEAVGDLIELDRRSLL